jgi:hypothetical protein
MLIGFILVVWIVWAALFCLGLCSAAARPMPKPDAIETAETQTIHLLRYSNATATCR